jgi:hypothetical protein
MLLYADTSVGLFKSEHQVPSLVVIRNSPHDLAVRGVSFWIDTKRRTQQQGKAAHWPIETLDEEDGYPNTRFGVAKEG